MTNHSSVPIAEILSLSVLRNRNSSSQKAIQTSQSVVPNAGKPGSRNDKEAVATATGHSARCSLRYVPSAAKTQKYHSSHAKIGQCTAVTVSAK